MIALFLNARCQNLRRLTAHRKFGDPLLRRRSLVDGSDPSSRESSFLRWNRLRAALAPKWVQEKHGKEHLNSCPMRPPHESIPFTTWTIQRHGSSISIAIGPIPRLEYILLT